MLPGSINTAGRGKQSKSGQRQPLHSRTEQGFPLFGVGTMLRGWALAEQGQGEEGIAADPPGLGCLRGLQEQGCGDRHYLALLAEAYGKAGQVEEGLSVAGRSAELSEQNWRAFLRGRAVSAEGRTPACAGKTNREIESSGHSIISGLFSSMAR